MATKKKGATCVAPKSYFKPDDRLRPISAVDLLKLKLPPTAKYWSNYIRDGNLVMIYGWRGIGKSHLVLCLAVSMATGAKFLGRGPEKPLRVVIMDGEMSLSALKARLKRTCSALSTQPNENLRFISPETYSGLMPRITEPDGQVELETALGHDWDVLVIDNYGSFSGGREDADAWAPWAKWLMVLRRRGKTVILVHHTGKNGKQRGASNHEDIMDACMSISPPKTPNSNAGGHQFVLRWEKARHIPSKYAHPMLVSCEKDDDGIERWSKSDELDPLRARAVEMLKQGKTQAAIARELGVNKSTISRRLDGYREDKK